MIPTDDRVARGPVGQTEKELLWQQLLELGEMSRELSDFVGSAPPMKDIAWHCLMRAWHLGERHGRERILRRVEHVQAN